MLLATQLMCKYMMYCSKSYKILYSKNTIGSKCVLLTYLEMCMYSEAFNIFISNKKCYKHQQFTSKTIKLQLGYCKYTLYKQLSLFH